MKRHDEFNVWTPGTGGAGEMTVDCSKYDEIIIWGAAFPPNSVSGYATSSERAMEMLASVLKKNRAWERVVAIVDSNADLYGRNRLNVEVKAPEVIREHPNALVIINTISFRSVEKTMKNLKVHNDYAIVPYYFYHGTIDCPYDNAAAKADIEENLDKIRELYELEDEETRNYLEIIASVRLRGEDDLYAPRYYDGTGYGVDYFCDPVIAPRGEVTYFDVGAYDGESIEPVRRFYGDRLKKCFAFEPDGSSENKLRCYLASCGLSEITRVLPYALGDEDTQVRFSSGELTSSVSEDGEFVVEQRMFDHLGEIEIDGDAMLKMDIEGSEMKALKGMAAFIEQRQPYLAICVYHREADLCAAAQFIKGLNPGYRLYIRGGWHLECWAVPERHFNERGPH